MAESPDFLELTPLARGEPGDHAGYLIHWESRTNEARKFYELGCSCSREGQFDEAVQALECALELSPNNIGIEFELARSLSSIGQFEEAEMLFERIITRDPGNGFAYFHLGSIKYQTGALAEAVELWECASRLLEDPSDSLENLAMAYRRWGNPEKEKSCWLRLEKLSSSHPLVRHMLAAHGVSPLPDRAEDLYLKHLFNRFSRDFDNVLKVLQYSIPDLLPALFREIHGEPNPELKILDAGCGTGLCGEKLRPWASHLTGVDISAGMLAKAKLRNIYDQLIESELNAFLDSNEEAYDWIVAGDVLCYCGDLTGILRGATGALLPGGRLYFSVEKDRDTSVGMRCGASSSTGYQLQSHGRYSHAESYIINAARAAGLNIKKLSPQIIRYESGQPVDGFSVLLEKCRVC